MFAIIGSASLYNYGKVTKGRSVERPYIMRKGALKSHANSNQFCPITEQKDSSGCGACRMAKVYRTI